MRDEEISLAPHTYILRDKEGSINLQNILSGKYDNNFLPLKTTDISDEDTKIFWLKFKILNDLKKEESIVLYLLDFTGLYGMWDNIEYHAYVNAEWKHKKSGKSLSINERYYRDGNSVIQEVIRAGETVDIYLRIQRKYPSYAAPKIIDPYLMKESAYLQHTRDKDYVQGIFLGAMAVMLFYNLFLYFSLRDRSYLYYCSYIFSFIVLWFSYYSYGFRYIWGDFPTWNNLSTLIFTVTTASLGALFGINYLHLKKNHPLYYKILFGLSVMSAATLIFGIAELWHVTENIIALLSLLISFSLLSSAVVVWLRGFRPALFFIIAWTLVIASIFAYTLHYLGLFEKNFFATHGMQFSSVIETLLLSLGLADRVRVIQKEKENAIELSLINLQKSDRLKDEFLANTSHELRTPINGIVGIVESMIDGSCGILNENVQENLMMVSLSGRRLSSLINDILDVAKLKKGDIRLDKKSVDVRSIVEFVIELSSPLIKDNTINLESRIEKNLPAVWADENRLQQIFLNLIGNAIKFTERGTIEINSVVRDNLMYISVKDTGIGIPSEKQNEIFGEFYQVDGSVTRMHEGSGLGLSITKKLVELHGGTIQVESGPGGRGSIFSFSLPLSEERASSSDLLHAKNNHSGEFNYNLNSPYKSNASLSGGLKENRSNVSGGLPKKMGPTILAVDDDLINLHVIESQLSIQNFNIVKATNGNSALKLISDGLSPDLILLDIMMPGMSGLQVSREIRKDYSLSDIPIIMLTAKNLVDDAIHGFEAGANDYIMKPFDKRELLTRVNTLISLKKKIEESIKFNTLKKELQIAHEIHRSLLPSYIPQSEKHKIAVKYIPKAELGGDFYDFNTSADGNKISIIISDVSGHGYPSALVAAMLKVIFHSGKDIFFSKPSEFLVYMNQVLIDVQEKNFTTTGYLFCDLNKMNIHYANGGHTPLYIFSRKTGELKNYNPKGTLLGCFENSSYREIEENIFPGDRIVLFTDGISEAVNIEDFNKMFGDDRFETLLTERDDLYGEDYLNYFFDQFFKWRNEFENFYDDVTLIIIDIM